MALRFDDQERTLHLSVRDLVDAGPKQGHLGLAVIQRSQTRLAQGQQIHLAHQAERSAQDASYQAEVRLKRQIAVGGWVVQLHGRVDGLSREDERLIVEEIKSTTLEAGGLYATSLDDWADYAAQLRLYLWMLHGAGHDRVVGRLVLISISDGSRHLLGVSLDNEEVQAWVHRRLTDLVEARDARIAWMAQRRKMTVPLPHTSWRPGQEEIAEAVERDLTEGRPLLVEAPTGLGKTAAALTGALRYALAHDKVVFWATSRNTQQPHLQATLRRFVDQGLPLRAVLLSARERACLQPSVDCDPDRCPFSRDYYDKLREHGVVSALAEGISDLTRLQQTGRAYQVCPFELAMDTSERVDVIVGDYNYAFDPSVALRRHFSDQEAERVVVVADEVHQLMDRARGYGSPAIDATEAREVAAHLFASDPAYSPFAELALAVADRVDSLRQEAPLGGRDGRAVAELPRDAFADLADAIDQVGLDYALLAHRNPAFTLGQRDRWADLARGVLRLQSLWSNSGPETVAWVDQQRPGLGLLCLDPSPWLGPWIRRLGGFVGLSATLPSPAFHRDLLGLDRERLDILRLPSPFPPENRRVVIAPRVSTAFKDRAAHAASTARLIEACVEAIDGNVACYFPSFEMLRDLTGRLHLPDRDLLVQDPAMDPVRRQEHLARLSSGGRPVVLAAVLGGIFAEGVDLPAGALKGVLVAGPALPPVGLERELLRAYYDERYGDGFGYASLIPGMTRVVQAAGRLIRRPEDRGIILLLGRRFRWRDVAALLPADWEPVIADEPVAEVRAFFEEPG